MVEACMGTDVMARNGTTARKYFKRELNMGRTSGKIF
jgi:hypothetical protein